MQMKVRLKNCQNRGIIGHNRATPMMAPVGIFAIMYSCFIYQLTNDPDVAHSLLYISSW